MTEEIINSDGSRNWEANILLDNIKRLEQENEELKNRINEQWKLLEQCGINSGGELRRAGYIINDFVQLSNKYRSALEEIKTVLKFYADSWVDEKMYPNLHFDNTKAKEGLSKINEVLNDN